MKFRESSFSAFCIRAFTFTFLAAGFAGCGGGGVSTTPTVVITTANSPAVAGAAVEAAIGATTLPIAAATSTSSTSASASAAMQTIGKTVVAAAKKFNNQSQTPVIVTGVTNSYPCTVSGTYTYDASGNSGSLTFNSCVDVTGETLSGSVTFSNMVVNNTTGAVSGKEVLSLTMAMTSPAEIVTIAGDINFSYTTASMHMYGSSLTYTSNVYGSKSMVNYDIVMDLTTGAVTESFSFNSAALGGVATVTVTTPFNGVNLYPNTGVATVTGASNTVLKITILGDETAASNSQVKLEVSTDGGATWGTPSYVTWASLNMHL